MRAFQFASKHPSPTIAFISLAALLLGLTGSISAAPAAETNAGEEAGGVKPLKALLVLGGCCHDYAKQKDILAAGHCRARQC